MVEMEVGPGDLLVAKTNLNLRSKGLSPSFSTPPVDVVLSAMKAVPSAIELVSGDLMVA